MATKLFQGIIFINIHKSTSRWEPHAHAESQPQDASHA